MINGIIYMYTSPSNKIYIGQTKYESKRRSNHKCSTLKKDTAFGKALKKYGFENFKYEVIFKCNSFSNERLKIILDIMEIYLIKKFNSIKCGYNITSGGSVTIVNEETKIKISNTLKGRTFSEERKKNISEAHKGILLSEEAKQKISNANTGRVFTDEQRSHMNLEKRKSILQYNINSEFIKEWESIASITRELGLCGSNIILVCKGVRKSAGKCIWKYKE